jgi:sugar lactone lactonase YvrE
MVQTIRFDAAAAPKDSYLNDVRVDRGAGAAYITDSGLGAIVVVDLASGRSRRLLDGHVSTRAENRKLRINGRSIDFPVHADGLALSNDNAYLYYKPMTGLALYRIAARALRDASLSPAALAAAVEFVATTMPCDGLEFDARGRLIITAIEENALYRLAPGGRPEKLVADERLAWPDSVAVSASGDIFVTASRIQFPPGGYQLFRIRMPSAAR